MCVLSIDSSGYEQIKIEVKSDNLYDSLQLPMRAQNMPLLILTILQRNKLEFTDISEVKVAVGPDGSFTGLRIGACIANVLGYMLGIKVNGLFDQPVIPTYSHSYFD